MVACLSLLSITFLCFLEYLYLLHYSEEDFKLKKLFVVAFDKNKLIFVLFSLLIALGVYAFQYFKRDIDELRSITDAIVALWLLMLGFIDFKDKIIPNTMIISGIVFWLGISLVKILSKPSIWLDIIMPSLIGAFLCGGILLLVAFIAKNALGMGDVKLFSVIGLLYGFTSTYSILVVTVFIMAIVSIVLLVAKKATRKTAIPMAPFVAAGFLLSVFAGL